MNVYRIFARYATRYAALAAAFILTYSGKAIDYGDFPQAYLPPSGWEAYEFQDPGGWITVDVTANGLPKDDYSVDAGPKILEILGNYTDSQKVRLYFPAGRYYLKSHLDIVRGNLWIDGDIDANGDPTSVVEIDVPTGTNAEFRIGTGLYGGVSGPFSNIVGTVSRGDNTVDIQDGSIYSVGDVAAIYEDLTDGGIIHTRGQLATITGVSGKSISFDRKMAIDIPVSSNERVVVNEQLVECVKVSDMKFTRTRQAPSGTANLRIYRVRHLLVDNVESTRHALAGIALFRVLDGKVVNCFVHNFLGPSQGSWGDGIFLIALCTNVHVTNNTTYNERHGLWLGLSTNHCVISYNWCVASRAYADFGEHHGFACHSNLFEGNDGFQMFSDTYGDVGGGTDYSCYFRNYARTKVGFERVSFASGDSDHYNGSVVGNYVPVTVTKNLPPDLPKVGVVADMVNGHVGANIEAGTLIWGDHQVGDVIPPSLVYESKPSYVESWPLYGPGADAPDLFFDDFTFGPLAWSEMSGSWSVASREYIQAATSGEAKTFAGADSWTDYFVEARAQLTSSGGSVSILGRAENENRFYALVLKENEAILWLNDHGSWTRLADSALSASLNTWYSLRLTMDGSNLRGFVDGVEIISTTDTTLTSGKVGLRTINASGKFDDVWADDDLSSSPPPPPPSGSLFDDDFSGGSGAWTPISGSWSVISEEYDQLASSGDSKVKAGNSAWTDYSVEVRARITGGSGAANVLGRLENDNRFYAFVIKSTEMILWINDNGSWTRLGDYQTSIASNTWYTLKLEMVGATLKGYLDGVERISATDNSIASGQIGLRTFNASARFDDVVVIEE